MSQPTAKKCRPKDDDARCDQQPKTKSSAFSFLINASDPNREEGHREHSAGDGISDQHRNAPPNYELKCLAHKRKSRLRFSWHQFARAARWRKVDGAMPKSAGTSTRIAAHISRTIAKW